MINGRTRFLPDLACGETPISPTELQRHRVPTRLEQPNAQLIECPPRGLTSWRTLLRDLTDNPTDNHVDKIDNTGLPFGPDDFAGGFQWSATVAAGSTETFLTQFARNVPLLPRGATAVPEPNSAILSGLGLI